MALSFRRGRLTGAVVAVLALAVASGCNAAADAQWQGGGSGDPSSGPATGTSQLTLTPAANAKNVSPTDPIKAEIVDGTLDTVALTNAAGKAVQGEFDADKRSWQNAEELGYNKTYTLVVNAIGSDGQKHTRSHTFTTVKPKNLTLPYLRANVGTTLGTGKTYGVGQPVVVWFDEPITDRAAAERTLTVTADPPAVGGWHWFSNREVHWRPQEYWTPGTKVSVQAKVYGKDLGDGLYGQEDVSASFTIGASKILIADSKTFHMKVYVNGKQVTKIAGKDVTNGIPISMGKTGTERDDKGNLVDWRTYSGVHVMTLKYDLYRMTSASFGITDPKSPNYYDEKIAKAIRISNSGEFVHKRDWTVWQMGQMNTSHGCINVGSPYIDWIYANFGAGDIVDVRNTGKNLAVWDGLGDWTLSWEKWQEGSALS